VAPGQLAEGMQGLYDPRALRPATARAGGQGDYGDFTLTECGEADFPELGAEL